MPRKCGACSLCCIVPEIPELDKPANTPCKNLTARGCGIYETRPQVCRDFECDWLMGKYGDATVRPDYVGAYITQLSNGDGLGHRGLMVCATPNSTWHRFRGLKKIVDNVVNSGFEVLVARGEARTIVTHNEEHLGMDVHDQDGRPVSVQRGL